MKPKTFTPTFAPKQGNGEKNVLGTLSSSVIEALPPNLTTQTGEETETEDVEGLTITVPGEADSELQSPPETESTQEDLMEETGTDLPGEGLIDRDSFFASYPELYEQSLTEVIIGTDERVRITQTTLFPWRAICALKITARDGTRWIGTGFLISPRTVITAGHCVYMHAHGGWARSVEVIPGLNETVRPFGTYTGTTFRSVAGWVNSRRREYDYGAIILPSNSRPGDRTGAFGFAVKNDAFLKTSILNLSGYPGDKGGAQQWYMALKAKSVAPRVIYYNIDTMGGQSGSPVWVRIGTTRYVVGIHTNGHITGNSATRIVTPVFNNLQAWKTLGM